MILTNRGRWATALLYGILELAAPCLHGQTAADSQKNPPAQAPVEERAPAAPRQKVAIGFRVRTLPDRSLSVMGDGHSMATTTVAKTNFDTNFVTTAHSPILGGGLSVEAPVSRRAIVTVELLFNRLRYDKVTDVFSGIDDPTTAIDERSRTTTTENTQARVFDLPVLVHYGNLRPSGLLAHLYLAGGATAREVSTVRTTNNITNPDATTANNQIPAQVAKRTLLGATVGAGFRFMDEFNIKVTPEVRYTRWAGVTFGQDSTRSPRNQLEVGIGFSR
jgi:hypothetical protein